MTTTAKVDVYCASCGEETEADALTRRCLRCGKLAMQASTQASTDRSDLRPHASPSAAYRETPRAAGTDPTLAAVEAARQRELPGSKFNLPGSASTRKWIDQTRALEAGFRASATEAEKKAAEIAAQVDGRIAAYKAEAVRLRNAASVFTQLLQQVGIDETAPARATRKGGRRAVGEWARSRSGEVFAACTKCGRTDVKHKAKGRCERCY